LRKRNGNSFQFPVSGFEFSVSKAKIDKLETGNYFMWSRPCCGRRPETMKGAWVCIASSVRSFANDPLAKPSTLEAMRTQALPEEKDR
jgi:hypothetical protein